MGIEIIGIITIMLIFVSLILKIYFMKKSIKEIRFGLKDILKTDTNNLLTISSSDEEIKNLVNDLNIELKNLREQRLQYENGNQELKKSITNISHDMRTPLTAISGYIDLIKESENREKQNEYINIIRRKTNDLTILTEQLFDFSKATDLNTKIKREKQCINEILEEVIANYYTILKEKNIIQKIEICKERIYKNVDKNTIIRVFENILSNVIKYSEGDLSIILNDKGKITFSNKTSSLDQTTIKKIFDRYYTVENAKKSTGIGLSIAKQLIELNNGRIIAKYEKNYLIIEIEFSDYL